MISSHGRTVSRARPRRRASFSVCNSAVTGGMELHRRTRVYASAACGGDSRVQAPVLIVMFFARMLFFFRDASHKRSKQSPWRTGRNAYRTEKLAAHGSAILIHCFS